MKEGWFVKTLALSIVVLFIGISFQPVFAVDIKSTDEKVIESKSGNNEKVEYEIQIIKTNKIIENKVYLTQQQANDLENLIEGIRFDLNNSESSEETTEIYYNAINSFNNLGLFTKDITLDEIKQLVTGETQKLDSIKFKKELGDGFENRLCLVSCNTNMAYTLGPVTIMTALACIPPVAYMILFNSIYFKHNLSEHPILVKLLMTPMYLYSIIILALLISSYLSIMSIQPITIGSLTACGLVIYPAVPSDYFEYYPSNGWIQTFGLNGKKSYNGNFYGDLFYLPLMFFHYYCSMIGFTGISIRRKNNDVFRLGFALDVKINNSPKV